MNGKFKYTVLFFSIIFFIACKQKDSFKRDPLSWSAAMSNPYFYRISGPHVTYFNKGKIINGTEALLVLCHDCDWSQPVNGRNLNSGIEFPDSVFVSYCGLNEKMETWIYEGGAQLPSEKIKNLFKKGYFENGKKEKFDKITTGMAPGGRVCVWVDFVEITHFTVKPIKMWSKKALRFTTDSLDEKEVSDYLEHHPIDYKVWEKEEAKYDIDFGFTNESENISFNNYYFVSKSGFSYGISDRDIDYTVWNEVYGKEVTISEKKTIMTYDEILKKPKMTKKLPLPSYGVVEWFTNETLFSTEIVFQENLRNHFVNPNTGKITSFNRIVFGVEKDGEHCVVWLDGRGEQKKIMRFKGKKAFVKYSKIYQDTIHYSGGYATEISYY